MRAISLWQPWGSLLFAVPRLKLHETRHWSTAYRGQLAIHAAQRPCPDVDDELADLMRQHFGARWRHDLPRGCMLGIVTMSACLPTDRLQVDDVDRLCGNFEPGRFAWRLENPRPFDPPKPAKGRQGFFDWRDAEAPAPPAPAQGSLL